MSFERKPYSSMIGFHARDKALQFGWLNSSAVWSLGQRCAVSLPLANEQAIRLNHVLLKLQNMIGGIIM